MNVLLLSSTFNFNPGYQKMLPTYKKNLFPGVPSLFASSYINIIFANVSSCRITEIVLQILNERIQFQWDLCLLVLSQCAPYSEANKRIEFQWGHVPTVSVQVSPIDHQINTKCPTNLRRDGQHLVTYFR